MSTLDRQSIFTIKELESISQRIHDGDEEAMKFIIIDKMVYDVTEFIEDHPGGAQVLLTHVGKDASDVFHAMRPESAYEVLNNYFVGDVQETVVTEKSSSAQFAVEMRQLRDQLKKEGYFHSSKLFYAYKVLSTLAICIAGLSLLYAYGVLPLWLSSHLLLLLVSFGNSVVGWLTISDIINASKTALGTMFLVVFLGNFCQGFSLSWWKDKHNVHHASTNVHGQDPDIDTAPVLLWDEYASAAYYASLDQEPTMVSRFLAEQVLPHQTRYFFFILAFARLSWALQSLSYSFKKESINKSRQLNLFERVCIVGHWALFAFCIYSWCSNVYHMVLFFLVSQATTGYTLALVFALNHNGMPVITEEKAESMEFFEIQVITGRDVTLSPLGDWFMGGLNYQIEHHVFPNMPRHNLPTVMPMVKSLCQKYDINYHDTGFLKGTLEVLQTLDITSKLSLQLSKKSF
uniref:Delta-6-fatty acid desaturase n=2 Tax=Thamnidium elegans TaxID=101142 RepID=Q58KB0_9FUNG|nr:delta-6-fatty acid desaturase [Thamnidium elegans]AAZ72733.1 delta-6-fatty acid desaturase [Thamnidium elegans]